MNTKDRYMLEALRLFSEKGYGSVGVSEIAASVGCTTSALYKHFPNKKALFDEIVEKSRTEFRDKMINIHFEDSDEESFRKYISKMNVEKQVEMIQNLFLALTEDNAPKYFRKLVRMEQYDHPELSENYRDGYVGQLLSSFESIMNIWIEEGRIGVYDPKILALEYISPLLTMVELCDIDASSRDDCLELLKKHIINFNIMAN